MLSQEVRNYLSSQNNQLFLGIAAVLVCSWVLPVYGARRSGCLLRWPGSFNELLRSEEDEQSVISNDNLKRV